MKVPSEIVEKLNPAVRVGVGFDGGIHMPSSQPTQLTMYFLPFLMTVLCCMSINILTHVN